MITNTAQNLKAALPPIAKAVPNLKRKTSTEMAGPCPKCGGKDRFCVWPEENRFWCRQCDWNGDVIKFHEHMKGLDFNGLAKKYLGDNGRNPKAKSVWKTVAEYIYHDPEGNPSRKIVKQVNPDDETVKNFPQKRWDDAKWVWGTKGIPAYPYHLRQLLESSGTVFITEGEKDVETLEECNFVATCNPGGAGKWPGMAEDLNQYFKGRDIVIIPDNDEAGRKHAQQVARSLHGVANTLKVVELPDLPEKGDVSDFLALYNDVEKAAERITIIATEAPLWKPTADDKRESRVESMLMQGLDKKTTKPKPIPEHDTHIDRSFNFKRVGDLKTTAPSWLFRSLIERDSFSEIFSAPGCGKTFMAIDMACCVATGIDFHGLKTKQGPVCYIAGEGQNGLVRRFSAWSIRHDTDLKKAPLFVSTMPAALCDARQVEHVLAAIDKVATEHGDPLLIVIDTLARNFGPGDENSTRDMSLFIKATDTIRCNYRSTVLLIHHTGHGDKKRARGAMALKGALDAEYRLDKDNDGVIRFEATKMKDAPFPKPMAFLIRSVELGLKDDSGNPVTSAILVDTPYRPRPKKGKMKLGKWQAVAIEALQGLQAKNPNSGGVPVSEWRDECIERKMPRTRFYDARDSLIGRNIVTSEGEYVTLDNP